MRKLFYAIRHYLKMRKIRRRNRSLGVDIALIIILGAFGLFSLYPLIYIIVSAFKPMSEVFIFPPRLVVENPTLNNFFDLGFIIEEFDIPFSRYAFNTLIITGLGTAGTVLLGSMAAFPLAKYEFPGSKLMSNIIVYALMFSSSVTAIPNYFIMSAMNLIDTIWAVILPAVGGTLGLYLMKNFMVQIPDELLEAAKIDGAGEDYIDYPFLPKHVGNHRRRVYLFGGMEAFKLRVVTDCQLRYFQNRCVLGSLLDYAGSACYRIRYFSE